MKSRFLQPCSGQKFPQNWADNDVICFSIGSKDPSKKLVAALQHRKLNVCSEAEWRRKLACGFSVQFNPVDFDSAEEARVHFQSGDLREVNTGEVHFATFLRGGDYSLKKTDGRWSIERYVSEKSTK